MRGFRQSHTQVLRVGYQVFLLGIVVFLVAVSVLVGCVNDNLSAYSQDSSSSSFSSEQQAEAPNVSSSASSSKADSSTSSSLRSAASPEAASVTSEHATSSSLDSESGKLYVRFVDVGQGDCALVSCDGHHMLIDGGPPTASQRVYTVLQNEGIDHLDAIIATHPDADHIGGIAAALHAATCEACYCSTQTSDTKTFTDMVKYLDAQGKSVTVPQIPTSFKLGDATVTLIGPVRTFDSDNNNSIVCRIDHGASSFLFMGDAEEEAEEALITSGVDLHAEVLKVGHHGSEHSTSLALLKAVNPTYAIISVGAQNDYGHPTIATLQRMQEAGVEWWRTDESGDIVAASDGTYIYISPTKEKVEVQSESGKEASSETKEVDVAGGADTAKGAVGAAAESAGAADTSGGTTSVEHPAVWYETKTYILNTRSKKIHLPDCRSAKEIKDHNKREVRATLDELYQQHYTACGICKPDKQ